MTPTPDEPMERRLDRLRAELEARAAGCWRLAGDRLEQLAFSAARDLSEEVARGFAEATRSVALSQANLGIVRAALAGEVAVSLARDLPADSGSGYWLRAFGASRSVAVPLRDPVGSVHAVLSLALGDTPDDVAVAEHIIATARAWPPLP